MAIVRFVQRGLFVRQPRPRAATSVRNLDREMVAASTQGAARPPASKRCSFGDCASPVVTPASRGRLLLSTLALAVKRIAASDLPAFCPPKRGSPRARGCRRTARAGLSLPGPGRRCHTGRRFSGDSPSHLPSASVLTEDPERCTSTSGPRCSTGSIRQSRGEEIAIVHEDSRSRSKHRLAFR
jgi:hypothetical protein